MLTLRVTFPDGSQRDIPARCRLTDGSDEPEVYANAGWEPVPNRASGGLLTGELAGVRSRGSSYLDNHYSASGHASVRVGKGKANRSGTIDPTSDDNIALPALGTFARVSYDGPLAVREHAEWEISACFYPRRRMFR